MEAIKLNIKLDNNWLEATWTKEVTTINDVEKEVEVYGEVIKEIVQEELVTTEQLHCESFSGHKEHIEQLRAKSKQFNTSLKDFEPLIKQCEDAFIYPSDEEIETEKRKQIEIQFRFDRDVLLKQTDIAINKAEDLEQDTKELRLYRQKLRDSTNNWVIPESIL